jgi:hypothetical protein
MPGIFNADTNATIGLEDGAIPLISFRDSFLDNLSIWHNSIPLRTQWVVVFDDIPIGLRTSILQNLEIVTGSKDSFNIDKAKAALLANENQKLIGCVYVQGVDIPPETLSVKAASIENNRGFITGSVIGDRESYANEQLTIQFRETNTSFADFIIRPWLILASHHGYVARDLSNIAERNKNTKGTITILQYAKTVEHVSMIPRKIWTFHDVVPLNVGSRELSYDAEQLDKYNVPFLYSYYEISSNLTSLPNLLTKLHRG